MFTYQRQCDSLQPYVVIGPDRAGSTRSKMMQSSPPPPPPAPPVRPRRIPRWALIAGSVLLIAVLGTVWWITRDTSGAPASPQVGPSPTLGMLLQGTPSHADSAILGGAPAETPTAGIPAPPSSTIDPVTVPTLGPGTPVLPHTSSGQSWPCGTPMPDGRVLTEEGPIPCATAVP